MIKLFYLFYLFTLFILFKRFTDKIIKDSIISNYENDIDIIEPVGNNAKNFEDFDDDSYFYKFLIDI